LTTGPISNAQHIEHAIADARANGKLYVTCQFATQNSHAMHPVEVSLHLFYDQLNVIAKHLQVDTDDKATMRQLNTHQPNSDELGQSFTWKQIKKRSNLQEWREKRYKMLDDYNNQGMFSNPMPRPSQVNVHHMLWQYNIKLDGTKKAQMVCDGSTHQGTVTLGHTYANSLMAASERLFWAITAHKGLTAYGADVTNTFAEAPPPIHPLYMIIDEAFCEWWTDHLKRPPIPEECTVVRVQNALQGHPESPRLWEKHIVAILWNIGFVPT
jgi:hypothetical protein